MRPVNDFINSSAVEQESATPVKLFGRAQSSSEPPRWGDVLVYFQSVAHKRIRSQLGMKT